MGSMKSKSGATADPTVQYLVFLMRQLIQSSLTFQEAIFFLKFQLRVLGQVGVLGVRAPQHVTQGQEAEPGATMVIDPLLATRQKQEAVKVSELFHQSGF